jgi:hypothetical protein
MGRFGHFDGHANSLVVRKLPLPLEAVPKAFPSTEGIT